MHARTGISLKEFNDHTPVEVSALVKEHHSYQDELFRNHADLHRYLSMRIANTNLKADSQYHEPRQFVIFPWEQEIEDEMKEELLNTNWDVLENIYNN